jgi:hypothetical protein
MASNIIKILSGLFIPDPGVKKAPNPGSRIRNTAGTNNKMGWLINTDGKIRKRNIIGGKIRIRLWGGGWGRGGE